MENKSLISVSLGGYDCVSAEFSVDIEPILWDFETWSGRRQRPKP